MKIMEEVAQHFAEERGRGSFHNRSRGNEPRPLSSAEMGKLTEAKGAYQRALRVNPADVKSRYNLVWVLLAERRYQAALGMVAEALALDETGEYYERLLKKQNEILGRLSQRNQQKQFLLANRVSSKPAVAVPSGKEALVGSG
jgi:tetratricopeptide (TPR) repeat protein